MNPISADANGAEPLIDPSPGRHRRGRSGRALGLAGLSLVVVLSACGASARAGTSAATTATPTVTTAAAASGGTTTIAGGRNRATTQAYRDCLSQHGVTLPTRPTTSAGAPTSTGQNGGGGFGGGGGLQAALADPANKAAVDACASLLPAGGFGGGNGTGARGQALQAYDSCLADNGVTVPTTVAGGPPPSIDRTQAAFAAANTKCQALLPQRNAPTTTTVTG